MKRRSDTRYTELFSHPFFVRRLLESDVIWKVRFRGRDLYLFILIEFQSSVDQRMPLRLFRYIAELYESLGRPAKGGRYPAVFPLVLYNGRERWTAKRELAELIDASIPAVYIPRFRYYVIEERSFSPATLIGMRNLAALLFLAETLEPEELALSIDSFLDIVKAEDAEAVGLFSRWLNDYLRQVAAEMIPGEPIDLRIEEDRSMLAENFRIWRNKVYAEGRLEGRLEGKLEGKLEAHREANQKTAYKLLAMGMSPETVANFLEISPTELKALIEKK